MSIQWNRGLIRAWIVFAVVWVGAMGWATFGPSPTPLASQYDIPALKLSDSEIMFREARRFSWVVLPPVLLLLGGFAVLWTVRGFKD